MPIVEFPTRELLKLLGRSHKPEELGEKIPMLGVGLEAVDEERVVVEVFPNRPDMLSIEGFARALKGFLGIERGFEPLRVERSEVRVEVDPSVKEVRPFIAAALVKGSELGEEALSSLLDLQEKVHVTHGRNRKKVAIGTHDFDKTKPNFLYTTSPPEQLRFRPLDFEEELTLGEILEKHPKGREYGNILRGFGRYPVILDSKGRVISFPPIINAEFTKLTPHSKNVFVEVTGTSQLAVEQALNIIISALAERGGKVCAVEIR